MEKSTARGAPLSLLNAAVYANAYETPAGDEDHASAGAKSARAALPHPWKAAVKLSLSRSMRLGTPGILGDAE